ncbi:MAG: histidinol-phosphatase HisJ [Bacteroidetes bacterium]|nr:histidinol-phosphatase HisJ [Bacteroidota bacterium]
MLTNYHSHSNYCDGSNPLEDYILEAINLGFTGYGFSSHAPLPFACQWAMPNNQIQDYLRRIDYLKNKWKEELMIWKSLEIDYLPKISDERRESLKQLALDYTIGSVHFLDYFSDGTPWAIDDSHRKFKLGLDEIFQGDIQKVIKKYYQYIRKMVREEQYTIIGHLDKIKMHNKYFPYFDEQEAWYKEEIDNTLNTIKISSSFIEVNTRGWYKGKSKDLYPSTWILEEIAKKEIPIVLNSDAHMPSEISLGFDFALEQLKTIGFQSLKNYNGIEWVDTPIESILNRTEKTFVYKENIKR